MQSKTSRSLDTLPIEVNPFVGRFDDSGKPVITAPLAGCETTAAEGGFLPCLNSNISIQTPSTQHRKAASALGWNVISLSQKHGLENLGFLTLTFKDHVVCVKEAQRRLNSLLSNVIKPRYQDYIGVLERQKSGRIHYHLLVVLGFDIRTGFDFAAIEAKNYTSANPALRAEWAFWRKTAPAYGFGRTELMPIKSSEEAIGKYIGKYIGKHMESRQEDDKGARLVRYSRGARVATTRFQFVSTGSQQWRSKLKSFAHYVAARTGCEPTMEGIREVCGPRWAHHHRDFILSMPTATHAPGCDVGAHGAGGAVACEVKTVGLPPTPCISPLATPSGHAPSEALSDPQSSEPRKLRIRTFDDYCHSDENLTVKTRDSKPILDTSKSKNDS